MRARSRLAVFSTILATFSMFAACNLDLDESLINSGGGASSGGASGGTAGSAGSAAGSGGQAGTSGSSSGGSAGSAGSPMGGSSSGGAAGSGGGTGPECSNPTDCVDDTDPCNVGDCVGGQCVFETCPPVDLCATQTCGSMGCEASATYSFRAHQLNVGEDLASSPANSIAASGDFVYVATKTGLRAWRVTDPTNPSSVTVQQPPFAISRLIGSDTGVLILGPISAGKVSLAWLEHPLSRPDAIIDTTAVALNFTSSISAGYPSAPGGFFLVRNNAGEFYPAARLVPPLQPNSALTYHASAGIPANSAVIASSGTRLVTFRLDSTSGMPHPVFSIEDSAGTPSAQNSGEQDLFGSTGEASTGSSHRFLSAPDGRLFWASNTIQREMDAPVTKSITVRIPLEPGGSMFDATRSVQLESYASVSPSAQLAGPMAAVGTERVLVTAADPSNTSNSAVRSVKFDSASMTLEPERFVIPFTASSLGAAGGTTFGYLLSPSTATPPSTPNATIHIFAPTCS